MAEIALETTPAPARPTTAPQFTSYQKFVVAMLAFLQFTVILDFMILSPLGNLLMPALNIDPGKFGIVVSAYAFSAGASGMFAAGFADRFDRKRLLLFFYAGFVLGTLACGLANSFEALLAARMVTGIFAGVIGGISFAIVTDLFPLEQRGRVMGLMQTAFGASQVLGVPAGIYISNLGGWHLPFLMIVGLATIAGAVIAFKLQPIDGHLKLQRPGSPLKRLFETLVARDYRLAFAATALLSTGGFMLMPFGSAFSVHNVGIAQEDLPFIYLVTGLGSLFFGPLIGRLTDQMGKLRTFVAGSILTSIMVVIYTNLEITPLWVLCTINVIMFAGIFSRMIPAQALMSAIPAPANRGSFMAVSSSLQQMAGGLAAVVAGMIVSAEPSGRILHFDYLGYVLVGTSLLSIVMMRFLANSVER